MLVKDFQLRVPATCRPRGARDRGRNELTESIEEYVEGIWRLQQEVKTVGTGDIALYMNVAPASATTMLKRMAELGLVEHQPYQGVLCTVKGETVAVNMLRKHRLLERMLVDFLGLPWEDVHDLACKLEHYITMDVADSIARAMGDPITCPHGNPIDALYDDGSVRLIEAENDKPLVVVKITDERAEFLAYLNMIPLKPGLQVDIVERTPFGDVIALRVEGRDAQVAIGKEVSTAVWVRTKE